MRISATQAFNQKRAVSRIGFFGKMWNPGDTAIVVYPCFKNEDGEWELLVGCAPGHKCDPKSLPLKTTFIPSLSELDEEGNIVGEGDITMQFSRIARAFINGQKEVEMERVRNKKFPSEEAKRQAMNVIDEKFNGTNSSIKPVVQGYTYIITTECVYIPVHDNKLVVKDANVVSQPLSDKKLTHIMTLLSDPKFAPDDEHPYLQVQYSFPTGERSKAGQALPNGLTPEYRLETAYADEFKVLSTTISGLSTDSDMLMKRNSTYHKIPEQQIINALQQYAITSSEYLDALKEDTMSDDIERLERNASVLQTLNVINSLNNTSLVERLKKSLEMYEVSQTPQDTIETPMPTSAPKLQDMLDAPHIGDDEEIESIIFN